MMEALADFHFLRPLWLLALPLAPLLWWLGRQARAGAGGWREAVAPELLRVLLEERDQGPALRPKIILAAVVLTILALAGPTWERLPEPVAQRTDGLVVVLDVSMSMLAEDVEPSRMARARHKLADLLGQRQEGLTALVAYAGDAHVVTPLTDDTRTIANLVGALHPTMMPVQGSRPGAALELARQLYRNAGLEQGRVLLITDAVERARDIAEHATPSFPVSILGVGTATGAPIPVHVPGRPPQLLRADDGSVVQVRL
ncbi:MAG: VWA domain-containing protein, partial [Gammaproteobacteria bacterium]|nr:VWA domain-containing protein [Gammaproteobacteria bacterium]